MRTKTAIRRLFKALAFCWACTVPLFDALYAQAVHQDYEGVVMDGLDDKPLPRASLFVNNTTYASVCDDEGRFRLARFPAPPFDLVVSAVGYATQVVPVRATGAPLQVRMEVKVQELEGVVILPPLKDGWARFGATFIDDFIGYSAFSKQCTLLNKEALTFRLDKENGLLYVNASEPLEIRKEATGYVITYLMEDYERSLWGGQLLYKGYARFAPLEASGKKQAARWAANRASAFKGSLMHFMRAVHAGNASAEGYEARLLERVPESDYWRKYPFYEDTLAFKDSLGLAAFLQKALGDEPAASYRDRIRQWLGQEGEGALRIDLPAKEAPGEARYLLCQKDESLRKKKKYVLAYFDEGLEPPKRPEKVVWQRGVVAKAPNLPKGIFNGRAHAYELLRPQLLPQEQWSRREGEKSLLWFNDYLEITYLQEGSDKEYLKRRNLWADPLLQRKQKSLIGILGASPVIIHKDGNYSEAYDLLIEGYWSYEKLDKLLPLDFVPLEKGG